MCDAMFDLRSWIREQPHKGYEARFEDNDHFVLETACATAEVSFYNMDPDPEIVELRIEEKTSGDVKFFLHFHPVEYDHATKLYREMEQVLVSLVESQRTEVLLCCTAGMTTSFFADKLNQLAETMGLDWSFTAVSVNEAYEFGHDKAAVLIAPQIAYQAERVRKTMSDVPVLEIPTAIFASYDAAGCLEWVRGELRAWQEAAAKKREGTCSCHVKSDRRVLVIAVHCASKKMTLHYRVYYKGDVEEDEKVIKQRLDLADITDVIDTRLCACRDERIDVVGVALPGTLRDGCVDLGQARGVNLTDGSSDFVMGDYLSARYDVPVHLCNNANAAALGWREANDRYDDVTFYSQATGWAVGGQGHVVGGRLLEGAHGNAGEVKYIVDRFSYANPLHYNAFAPDDVLEMVGKVLAMDCATFDPQVVALRCDLLPDMEEVATELDKYVPRELQPKLVHVDDYDECILTGMLTRCLDSEAL